MNWRGLAHGTGRRGDDGSEEERKKIDPTESDGGEKIIQCFLVSTR